MLSARLIDAMPQLAQQRHGLQHQFRLSPCAATLRRRIKETELLIISVHRTPPFRHISNDDDSTTGSASPFDRAP